MISLDKEKLREFNIRVVKETKDYIELSNDNLTAATDYNMGLNDEKKLNSYFNSIFEDYIKENDAKFTSLKKYGDVETKACFQKEKNKYYIFNYIDLKLCDAVLYDIRTGKVLKFITKLDKCRWANDVYNDFIRRKDHNQASEEEIRAYTMNDGACIMNDNFYNMVKRFKRECKYRVTIDKNDELSYYYWVGRNTKKDICANEYSIYGHNIYSGNFTDKLYRVDLYIKKSDILPDDVKTIINYYELTSKEDKYGNIVYSKENINADECDHLIGLGRVINKHLGIKVLIDYRLMEGNCLPAKKRECSAQQHEHRDGMNTTIPIDHNFKEAKYRCVYCGFKYPASKITVDHLYPVNRYKKDPKVRARAKRYGIEDINDVKNLVAACADCNERKSDKMGLWILRGKIFRHEWLFKIPKIAAIVAFVFAEFWF